jgi:hypothetical protein
MAEVQIPEDLNEIFKSLKEFFASKNEKYTISAEENSLIIKFDEPLKLEEEEYAEFINLIKELNFFEANGYEDQINNFIGYKDWIGEIEFETWDGEIKMNLSYSKAWITSRPTFYYIKEIIIERKNSEAQEEEE